MFHLRMCTTVFFSEGKFKINNEVIGVRFPQPTRNFLNLSQFVACLRMASDVTVDMKEGKYYFA